MQLNFKNETAAPALTLADLNQNQSAQVDCIDLPAELAGRLMELGFLPGHMVEATHSAPGGDPRVFRVDGTEIALRRETACHILLRGK